MKTSSPNLFENFSAESAQDEQKTAYLEDLLGRQLEKLRRYDLDGSMHLAEESAPIARDLADRNVLDRPEFAERQKRIRGMYQELCLVIAAERQEVAGKLKQIREGIRALSGYAQK